MSFSVKAGIKGLDRLDKSDSNALMRAFYKRQINKNLPKVRKHVNASIRQAYTTRANPDSVAHQKQATLKNLNAQLWWDYSPHPLSWFNVRQIKITVGQKLQRVVNARVGRNRFKKSAAGSRSVPVTKVEVLRGTGYKTVEGRRGYKGWLQDAHGMIFERDQSETWIRGKRGPGTQATWSPLYGPSISQMAASKATARRFGNQQYMDNITVGFEHITIDDVL